MHEKATVPTSQPYTDDVVPDSLMDDFRGRPILTLLVFTVVIHVVIVAVSSLPYLKNQLFGADNSALSHEERLDLAVKEATASLRAVAREYDVKPQDLSNRFASGANAATSSTSVEPGEPANVQATALTESSSAIEKKTNQKSVGPDQPALAPEDEDDLF